MRAVIVREYGPYQNVEYAELDRPVPGAGQVLIETRAAGVSFAASLVIAGKYQRKPPLPFTPGTEVTGIVRAVGAGVSRARVGQRVMSSVDWGAHGEFCLAHEANVYELPEAVPFDEGVALVTSYPTSYCALVQRGQLQAGETVLVHGASGGVGLAAVEIAKAKGATVIAVAGGADKVDFVRQHGADHVVDHRQQDFREVCMDLTGGRGVDMVYDSIGGEVTRQSIRSLAQHGRLLVIGFACGTIPDIPANLLLVKNIAAIGLNYGTYMGWSPGIDRQDFIPLLEEVTADLFAMYAAGQIKPVIGARYRPEQFVEALDAVMARKVLGKCIVEFTGQAG